MGKSGAEECGLPGRLWRPGFHATERVYDFHAADLAPVREVLAEKAVTAAPNCGAYNAGQFGLALRSLQEWEQARRLPDAAVLTYLRVIERNPKAVRSALKPNAA